MRRLALALAAASILAAPAVLAQTAAPAARSGPSQDPAAAQAGTYTLDKRHASITAKVSHSGFSNYTFRFRGLDGTLEYDPRKLTASRVTFTVDPKTVDTGLADFDKELSGDDWLGSAPARFVSTALHPTGPRTGHLMGDLTLKGVTRPASFNVTFNGGGADMRGRPTLGFTAEGVIDRTQFGVSKYAGPVGKDVRLSIEAEFNKPK